jgi:hypothetical protein
LYQIRDSNEGVVARLRLPRDAYRLGEVVSAHIDFGQASQPTYKVSAFLETTESVAEVYQARDDDTTQRSTRQVCGGLMAGASERSADPTRRLQVHAEQHEVTWNLLQTTLTLAIPPDATPLFVTSAGTALRPVPSTHSHTDTHTHTHKQREAWI